MLEYILIHQHTCYYPDRASHNTVRELSSIYACTLSVALMQAAIAIMTLFIQGQWVVHERLSSMAFLQSLSYDCYNMVGRKLNIDDFTFCAEASVPIITAMLAAISAKTYPQN